MALSTMKDFAQYISATEILKLRAPVERENVNLGNYTFLPYVRAGIAAGLTEPWAWTSSSRGAVNVTLEVLDEAGTAHPVTQKLSVLGPGDVASFDAAQVVRSHPTPGDPNASTSDLVAVDFDRPDLPWMFTPAGPAAGRLMPWLQLVVVPDSGTQIQPGSHGELDRLVTTSDQLHPLEGAWAYAHAQVIGRPEDGALTQRLSDANAPLNCSRLLSPRRLDPRTAYVACVVPTFRAGRLAGLGLPPVATLDAAWHAGEGDVTLPVYYWFSFSTGERGDFEFLAHQLKGVQAPYGTGYRTLDTSSPAPGLEEPDEQATGRVQVVAGPLLSPALNPPVGQPRLPDAASQAWSDARTTELAGRLGEGPPDDPRVAPPLYAGSHVARTTTDAAPDWFRDLNLVPRNRVVAGLGARVVQMDQEKLMASAWQQVRGIDAANRALRLAQMARQLSASLHARHLSELDSSVLLGATRPVHTRVLDAPDRTLAATLRTSALPESVASGAWRRLARPAGRLARLPGVDRGERVNVLRRLVVGDSDVARDWRYDYQAPDGITAVSDLALSLVPDSVSVLLDGGWQDQLREGLTHSPALPDMLAMGDLGGINPDDIGQDIGRSTAVDLAGRVLSLVPAIDTDDPDELLLFATLGSTVDDLLSISAPFFDYVEVASEVPDRLRIPKQGGGETGNVTVKNSDARDALTKLTRRVLQFGYGAELERASRWSGGVHEVIDGAFRGPQLGSALGEIGKGLVTPGGPSDIDRPPLELTRANLLIDLHPAKTVTARITGRLSGVDAKWPAWLSPDWFAGGLVEPIMAAPHFRIPMALRLYEYDKEWLMPGAAKIEPHQALTLLQTNNVFVEAFLLGLNTEMANELLWRGYPTDRRGTYFSSFWRRVDDLTSEVHRFGDVALGKHVDPRLDGRIVLFVRGDLVRRFPGLVAHAMTEVDKDAHGVPHFQAQTIETLFQVPLAPDILLVGFDTTADAVRAGAPDIWFTLSENPTEPRFGLDEPHSADDPAPPEPLPHDNRDALDWADPDLSAGPFILPGVWLPGRVNTAKVSLPVDAAQFAHIVFQLPSRAAFLGHNLLDRIQEVGP
jgi:hypothetical protein